MRKITILFSLLIATVVLVAQSNGPIMIAKKYQDPSSVVVAPQPTNPAPVATKGQLSEGFEGTAFPPTDWTMIDGDADADNWALYTYGPHTGLQSAASASWTSAAGALTPNNYLVTPALLPVTGDSFTYWVAPQDPAYPADKYAVYVSTSGNKEADFTTQIFVETLTTPDSIWVYRAFSLDAYNGQMIYIAFRHYECTDNFMMKIDDVSGPATSGVGVETATVDNTVSVYPNPANAILNIRSDNKILNIRVFNIIGQTVLNEKPEVTHAILDINNLEDGMYYVEVETETGVKVKKIAITR